MSIYLTSYIHYYQAGLRAYRNNDKAEAKYNLLKAAECLFKLAHESNGKVREHRKRSAQHFLDLARNISPNSITPLEANARKKTAIKVGDEDDHSKAEKWIITEKPNITFDDVAGLDEVKEVIERRIIHALLYPDITKRWKKKVGGGVLLYGPPGTGKTMIAKAIAAEIDAAFFSVKCSDIMNKWVGEAEKNLKRLFDASRAYSRSVIFMDETDAIISKRGSDSTVVNRVIQEFLVQVDGFQSQDNCLLLLGATNRPWDIDEAALRNGRFGKLIYVGLPDAPARARIISDAFMGLDMDESIDIEGIAAKLDGFSGADIVGICEEATDFPYDREIHTGLPQRLEREDLEKAIAKTKPSVKSEQLNRYRKFGGLGEVEGKP